jgi:hypothetical protein
MKSIVHIYRIFYIYEQCFSLSACGVRKITEEWGELNPNWHLEAFGAFYTPFWASYASMLRSHFQRQCSHFHNIVCILNKFKSQNSFVFALPACPMIFNTRGWV